MEMGADLLRHNHWKSRNLKFPEGALEERGRGPEWKERKATDCSHSGEPREHGRHRDGMSQEGENPWEWGH